MSKTINGACITAVFVDATETLGACDIHRPDVDNKTSESVITTRTALGDLAKI